ncbi:uncharacterized protein PGTG_19150 [Puccinia graminis f. sp. tritici CRL 75-36-700-3]|uniref:Uncharacterized protein n=1 Tax=Puccinia graminis f. sp. tritici (strain CRL 75-36-700-3 / race SCCL) TaxID=418459 RepID=E3L9A9_PUCGT|nr:uncharacterized protein PGTG_19150 [Puccinia graminis f. sp. tritici CRL 75-36-700-3]EFP93134.1 hypothetical protein PGTG_19150 [Puccinia graminis f. sp. tritici CRL 75-36-700-3]
MVVTRTSHRNDQTSHQTRSRTAATNLAATSTQTNEGGGLAPGGACRGHAGGGGRGGHAGGGGRGGHAGGGGRGGHAGGGGRGGHAGGGGRGGHAGGGGRGGHAGGGGRGGQAGRGGRGGQAGRGGQGGQAGRGGRGGQAGRGGRAGTPGASRTNHAAEHWGGGDSDSGFDMESPGHGFDTESPGQHRREDTPAAWYDGHEEDQNRSTASPDPCDGLTLENYESRLHHWTERQLREVLGRQTGQSNRVPREIQEALRYHKMNYTKMKMMLALIGNVSIKTVNSFPGRRSSITTKKQLESICGIQQGPVLKPQVRLAKSVPTSPSRKNLPNNFNIVPPKGSPDGWDRRNGHLGAVWQAMEPECQLVFDARIFRHFSKIPIPYDGEEEEDDEGISDSPTQLLSSEEEEYFESIYNDLVNHEKVAMVVQKGVETDGSSGIQKQVLRHITRINSELYTVSTAYNLTYYLLTATRFPGDGSFCRELSNNPTWLQVVRDQWTAKVIFEAYSQGRQIQEVVEELTGSGDENSSAGKPSDIIRTNLRHKLNGLLAEALGVENAKFPKQKDPVSRLACKYPYLTIVQTEESTLSKEELYMGADHIVTSIREKWLTDIETGAFQIVHASNN